MAWIESHQSLHKHPKLVCLANALKIDRPKAIGHLHIFWWWCIDYAPTGHLSKFSAVQLADGADWSGDPDNFVQALEVAGFLDRDAEGFQVHDWLDFCGELVKQRCRRLKEKRRKFRHAIPSNPRHPTQPNQPNPTPPNPTNQGEETSRLVVTPEAVRIAWNTHASKLPSCVALSAERIKKIRARLATHDLAYWTETFAGMNRIKFLRGDNDRKWKATFDWIMANDENHLKVREGKYGAFTLPTETPVSMTTATPEPIAEPTPDEAQAIARFAARFGGDHAG